MTMTAMLNNAKSIPKNERKMMKNFKHPFRLKNFCFFTYRNKMIKIKVIVTIKKHTTTIVPIETPF